MPTVPAPVPTPLHVRRFAAGSLTVTVTGDPGQHRTVVLAGVADAGSASAITEAFASLLPAPDRVLVIDLGGVTSLDSTGVRALLVGSAFAPPRAPVVLRGASPSVQRVVDDYRLDEVFEIVA